MHFSFVLALTSAVGFAAPAATPQDSTAASSAPNPPATQADASQGVALDAPADPAIDAPVDTSENIESEVDHADDSTPQSDNGDAKTNHYVKESSSENGASPSEPIPLAEPPTYSKHSRVGIGGTLGLLTGIGISVRKHFESGFGFQVGGIGYVWDSDVWASAGVEAYYTFVRRRKLRFYGLFGASWFGSSGPDYDTDGVGRRWRHMYSFGPGVGLEFHFAQHFSWAIEVPAAIIIRNDDYYYEDSPNDISVGLLPIPSSTWTFYF